MANTTKDDLSTVIADVRLAAKYLRAYGFSERVYPHVAKVLQHRRDESSLLIALCNDTNQPDAFRGNIQHLLEQLGEVSFWCSQLRPIPPGSDAKGKADLIDELADGLSSDSKVSRDKQLLPVDLDELLIECLELIDHLKRISSRDIDAHQRRTRYTKARKLVDRLRCKLNKDQLHLLDVPNAIRATLDSISRATRHYWTFEFEQKQSIGALDKPTVIAQHPFKLEWFCRQVNVLRDDIEGTKENPKSKQPKQLRRGFAESFGDPEKHRTDALEEYDRLMADDPDMKKTIAQKRAGEKAGVSDRQVRKYLKEREK